MTETHTLLTAWVCVHTPSMCWLKPPMHASSMPWLWYSKPMLCAGSGIEPTVGSVRELHVCCYNIPDCSSRSMGGTPLLWSLTSMHHGHLHACCISSGRCCYWQMLVVLSSISLQLLEVASTARRLSSCVLFLEEETVNLNKVYRAITPFSPMCGSFVLLHMSKKKCLFSFSSCRKVQTYFGLTLNCISAKLVTKLLLLFPIFYSMLVVVGLLGSRCEHQ